MSVAFRPLLTAGAAGILLCGLSFIPSAHGHEARNGSLQQSATRSTAFPDPGSRASRQLALATSPANDATPYVIGGAGVLCAGAGFVARTARRGRRA